MAGRFRTVRSGANRWLTPAAVVAALVVLWQVWVTVGDVHDWILPAPSAVASAGWENRGALLGATMTTLTEAVVGLTLGTAFGLAVAFAIALVPGVRRAVWPLVVTSQTIPIIVLAPLVAVWFGYGLTPKIVLVALITFFPVAVATVAGLLGAEEEHIELVRSFGAGRWAELRYVRIPSAVGQAVAGVRIAAAYAVGDAVIGEYVGGTSGLGIFIDRSHTSYRTDQMLAGVVVIAVVSVALFAFVGWLGTLLMPWQREQSDPSPKGEKPLGGLVPTGGIR